MNTMAATRYAEEADQSAAAAVVGKHLDDPLPGITGTGKRLDICKCISERQFSGQRALRRYADTKAHSDYGRFGSYTVSDSGSREKAQVRATRHCGVDAARFPRID